MNSAEKLQNVYTVIDGLSLPKRSGLQLENALTELHGAISADMQAQSALQQSEQRLSAALSALSTAVTAHPGLKDQPSFQLAMGFAAIAVSQSSSVHQPVALEIVRRKPEPVVGGEASSDASGSAGGSAGGEPEGGFAPVQAEQREELETAI